MGLVRDGVLKHRRATQDYSNCFSDTALQPTGQSRRRLTYTWGTSYMRFDGSTALCSFGNNLNDDGVSDLVMKLQNRNAFRLFISEAN